MPDLAAADRTLPDRLDLDPRIRAERPELDRDVDATADERAGTRREFQVEHGGLVVPENLSCLRAFVLDRPGNGRADPLGTDGHGPAVGGDGDIGHRAVGQFGATGECKVVTDPDEQRACFVAHDKAIVPREGEPPHGLIGGDVRYGPRRGDLVEQEYEEPMREFSVTAYKWLGERVRVPLLLGEVTDGSHMNAGDFVATGVATSLRTSTFLKGGFTGAMRIAHLADAYHLRAEVHGMGLESAHLCMAIKNTTAYESLVWGNPIKREALVHEDGHVHAPTAPGVGFETLWQENGIPKGLEKYVK